MPPSSTAAPASSQPPKNRRAPERVVPAIPHALTRPKPSQPKPLADADAKAGALHNGDLTNGHSVAQHPAPPIVNGGSALHVDDTPTHSIEKTLPENGVIMPAVDTPGSRGSAAMSLSFGGTPELPTADSPQPVTPPSVQPQSPIATTSPASARKPTEKFDMRPIMTELPPAFVPSKEQFTPQSATSPHFDRPLGFPSHARPSNQGTHNIIFGGQDSSTASPAPPQSAGSAFASPTYPHFPATPQQHSTPQGHAHHISESNYRPHYVPHAQPAMARQVRQGYAQPMPQNIAYQQQGHMSYRFPMRDTHTPTGAQYVNGRLPTSPSASPMSSPVPERQRSARNGQKPLGFRTPAENAKSNFMPEAKVPYHAHSQSRQPQFHPQMPPPPQMQHPDVTASLINAEALRDHVLLSHSNPAFSDCQLVIIDGQQERQMTFDGHRIILYRSPRLARLIEDSESPPTNGSVKVVPIYLTDQSFRASALLNAIKYLYGGSLLQIDPQQRGMASGEHTSSNVERMETAVQFIATGQWLQMPSLANRAIELSLGLLHWDTIATVLEFALDGGLSQVWNVDDSSEDRISVSSSDDSLSRNGRGVSPIHEPYSTHLLNRIIEFIVRFFPISFYLDAAAPQLPFCPRFPPSGSAIDHESRPSRSNPRLSQIQFGDVPVDADFQRPAPITTTTSSILLSLPFPILKFVLEHPDLAAMLGPETAASVMRQVVAEREVRRNKALHAAAAHRNALPSDDAATSSAYSSRHLKQNLYWEESVEISSQHRAGSRLMRRKRDIDTPPSSGSCSESNK